MTISTRDSLEYFCPSQKKWRDVYSNDKDIPTLAFHYGLVLYRFEHSTLHKKVYHVVKEVPNVHRGLSSLRINNPDHVQALVKWIKKTTIKERKDDLSIHQLLTKLTA